MSSLTADFKGLTSKAVKASAEKHGYNQIVSKRKSGFVTAILTLVTVPNLYYL